MKRSIYLLAAFAMLASILGSFHAVTRAESRPNVLVIVSDDQRADMLSSMPTVRQRILDQGVSFPNGFVTTPGGGASRPSIHSGMYAHTTGAWVDDDTLSTPTFARYLHDAGYYTGLVGKFINSWDGSKRAEYDYWVSHARGGANIYFNQTFIVNGTRVATTGYSPYVLRDYALRFLEQAAQQPNPFLLYVALHNAHNPATPAPGDETLFPNLTPHRPPSHNEADMSDKPAYLRAQPLLSSSGIASIDAWRRTQMQNFVSLDRSIGALLDRLAQQGQLDNTLIVYTSDNGFQYGEHRLRYKDVVYEESVRVPFAVRYPPLISQPRVDGRLVANIDIAPTLLDLVGVPIPAAMDGCSLAPLLSGSAAGWRQEVLLEGKGLGWQHPFNAVRTDRYVYVENQNDRSELYDLQVDPYQLANKIDDPAYATTRTDLQRRLRNLLAPTQPTPCPTAPPTPTPSVTPTPGPTTIDDSSYAVQYNAWIGVEDSRATGTGYRSANASGNSILYTTAQASTAITLVTYRGPDQGKASIIIDGVDKGTIDLYSPTPEFQHKRTFSGLSSARHTIRVKVLGTKQAASSGTNVRVDGFVVAGTPIDDTSRSVTYTTWQGVQANGPTNNGYRSAVGGSSAYYSFNGPQSTWITARGPGYGIAEIYVDGKLLRTVDLYAATTTWKSPQVIGNQPAGAHRVRIRVTGTRNGASTGSAVVFDGASIP